MFTKQEFEKLEEQASQIRGFASFTDGNCLRENLAECMREAKSLEAKLPVINKQEWRSWNDDLSSYVYDVQEEWVNSWIKYAGVEFLYWSSKNIVIAQVILDFMGLAQQIYDMLQHLCGYLAQQDAKSIEDYVTSIGQRIDNLIEVVYSKDLNDKCQLLGNKLYSLYNFGIHKTPQADDFEEKRLHFENSEPPNYELTDTENNILEGLSDKTLKATDLLKKAGYDNSSHYRQILSNLVKRRIIGRNTKGYYAFVSDKRQD